MVISYKDGTISVLLEGDEISTGDYIFAQTSATDLVRIQFEKMFKQRKTQQLEELKNQLLADHLANEGKKL